MSPALVLPMLPLVIAMMGGQAPPAAGPPAGARVPPAGAPVKTGVNEALRQELLAMAREDQATALDDEAHPLDQSLQAWKNFQAQHRFVRIREIVAQHGWPGRSLVGEDGAHAAWILVQHADIDPVFQRSCLEAMRLAFQKGEATAQELSFLTDRVLEAEGKPQMYGTQGTLGTPSPAEEARIDANRQALGLEPWRVFIEKRRRAYSGKPPDTK